MIACINEINDFGVEKFLDKNYELRNHKTLYEIIEWKPNSGYEIEIF